MKTKKQYQDSMKIAIYALAGLVIMTSVYIGVITSCIILEIIRSL